MSVVKSITFGHLLLEFPLVTKSEPNERGHWGKRHGRSANQRDVLSWELLAVQAAMRLLGLPVTVKLTRINGKELDDDNLRGAMKAVRDEIAKSLGVNDRDPAVKWLYAQEPTNERKQRQRVRIEIDRRHE